MVRENAAQIKHGIRAERDIPMSLPILYIVVPCYNEEDVLPLTAPTFLNEIELMIFKGKIDKNSKILFVNDGSEDSTWQIICNLAQSDDHFTGIAQSRNRGHQNAVLAGLMEAKDKCDIAVSIDCDGQDDIRVIEQMVAAYNDGCDIVYGVRAERKTDTFFKRFTAQTFYILLNAMGVEAVYNHADFRLVSRRALAAFAEFKEVNLFLRGIFPLVGFKSSIVYYSRSERAAGKSHYPFHKMLALAIDGITSLSIKPIRLVTGFGLIVSILSIIGIIWIIAEYLRGSTVLGWASTACIICFFSGVQLLSIGIVGEYIGKIYMETKRRPRYIISERTDEMADSEDETINMDKKFDGKNEKQ